MRLLILGGTTEATELCGRLANDRRFRVTLSLAGRTRAPVLPPVPCRIGGFGGVDGLCTWLVEDATDLVIDATHPYATRISVNAVAAAARLGLPLLSIARPAWQPTPGDHWLVVKDGQAAAACLAGLQPVAGGTALLTVGRLEVPAFLHNTGWRLIVRTIDPPDALPDGAELLLDRGPFTLAAETALLANKQVEVLVTKNSGGAATWPKIAAARARSIPVIMMQRPFKPTGHAVATADAAFAHLERHASLSL